MFTPGKFPSLQLADKLMPMERNFQTKEFKIAGWSSNLLENASGEVKYNRGSMELVGRAI